MTWTAYQVSFCLLSPIHIGWRKLGNLQQTRPYVTGRNLWGAFTSRITRELKSNDYEGIGKKVDTQLAFSYFYPSTKQGDVSLWPWSEQWDKFAWTFLGSYASTSLENGRNAEAGSLHETEYIAPYTRDGNPVYLVGYIFEKDDYAIERPWQDALNKLQLGGERSYGWGRVRLAGQCQQVTNDKCFGFDLNCKEDHPLLTVPADTQLLAHTCADSADSVSARGTIEPLVGRETTVSTGFGKNHSRAEICWMPGGIAIQGERFQILEKGIWKRYPLS